jgi:hypothetical protein
MKREAKEKEVLHTGEWRRSRSEPVFSAETRDDANREDVRALHKYLQREVIPLLFVRLFNADPSLTLRLVEFVSSFFPLLLPSEAHYTILFPYIPFVTEPTSCAASGNPLMTRTRTTSTSDRSPQWWRQDLVVPLFRI